MTIRLARVSPEEAEAFAALHVACWREAYRSMVPDSLLAGVTPAVRLPIWQAALDDPARIVLGGYDSTGPVGFVMAGVALEPLFDGIDGHIQALYVTASYYRQGIGRRLLAATARGWLATGGQTLALGVLADNVRARRFYEALGGRLVKTGTYDWDGHQLDDAIYVFENLKQLATAA